MKYSLILKLILNRFYTKIHLIKQKYILYFVALGLFIINCFLADKKKIVLVSYLSSLFLED